MKENSPLVEVIQSAIKERERLIRRLAEIDQFLKVTGVVVDTSKVQEDKQTKQ